MGERDDMHEWTGELKLGRDARGTWRQPSNESSKVKETEARVDGRWRDFKFFGLGKQFWLIVASARA